jgi:hypothetical protein
VEQAVSWLAARHALAAEPLHELVGVYRVLEAPSNIFPIIAAQASATSPFNASLVVKHFDVVEHVIKSAVRQHELDEVWEIAFIQAREALDLATGHGVLTHGAIQTLEKCETTTATYE